MYRPATHLLRHSTDHRLAFWFPESDVPCHQALNVFSAACEGDPMVFGELPICRSLRRSPKNSYSVETNNNFILPGINPVHDWGANSWTEGWGVPVCPSRHQVWHHSGRDHHHRIQRGIPPMPSPPKEIRPYQGLVIKGPWWLTLSLCFNACFHSPYLLTLEVIMLREVRQSRLHFPSLIVPHGQVNSWRLKRGETRESFVNKHQKFHQKIKQTHGNTGFLHTTQGDDHSKIMDNHLVLQHALAVSILQGAMSCSQLKPFLHPESFSISIAVQDSRHMCATRRHSHVEDMNAWEIHDYNEKSLVNATLGIAMTPWSFCSLSKLLSATVESKHDTPHICGDFKQTIIYFKSNQERNFFWNFQHGPLVFVVESLDWLLQ